MLCTNLTSFIKPTIRGKRRGLVIDKPESKSQVQAQSEKGKTNLDSGLSLKSYSWVCPCRLESGQDYYQ